MNHSTGFKAVAIDCMQYETLKRVAAEINKRNITTAEGFRVHVKLKDVIGYAIDQLAIKYKVKVSK